jgi:hypothetical protein
LPPPDSFGLAAGCLLHGTGGFYKNQRLLPFFLTL